MSGTVNWNIIRVCAEWEAAGGLMVRALDSGASDLGLSPGWGHCVVLGKDLCFPSSCELIVVNQK